MASSASLPRSRRTCSSSKDTSKWFSMASLPRPVMMSTASIPAATASSMTYWMTGLSTTGSISLGEALVAGRNLVPRPAAGMTAFRMRMDTLLKAPLAGAGSDCSTGSEGTRRSGTMGPGDQVTRNARIRWHGVLPLPVLCFCAHSYPMTGSLQNFLWEMTIGPGGSSLPGQERARACEAGCREDTPLQVGRATLDSHRGDIP